MREVEVETIPCETIVGTLVKEVRRGGIPREFVTTIETRLSEKIGSLSVSILGFGTDACVGQKVEGVF